MDFDYFYGEQSEQFAFYRTPKVFYTDEQFRGLSTDAKLLYGILLDRVSLSARNCWLDEYRRVYIYMTVTSVESVLGCCHQKACNLLIELEKFGLIERRKQGQGKPARVYVKNFVRSQDSNLQKYENHTSSGMKNRPLEVYKSYANNTDYKDTDINETNPLQSKEEEDRKERNAYVKYFMNRLDMEILRERYPDDKEVLDAMLYLILDVVCSKRSRMRIAGDDKPVSVVKSQFLKLNSSHMEYVLECMKQNSTKVRNIKQYLLAALYNAPFTMKSYYQARVNYDFATGRQIGGKSADDEH